MMVRWAVRHNVPIEALTDRDFVNALRYDAPESAEDWASRITIVRQQMAASKKRRRGVNADVDSAR